MSFLSKIFPSEIDKLVKKLAPVADKVFSYEDEIVEEIMEEFLYNEPFVPSRTMVDVLIHF